MSLPGLQLSAPPEPVVASAIHELNQNTEWRFETAFGSHVEVKLLSGTAEIFGTELAIKQPYTFNGTKAAVYTWHGCRIEVTGECLVEYIAEENPMISYANTHFALEQLRGKAILEGREGPRVMVLGPENAGKTSLVKILTAYATRTGRQPVVVNLDTKEGMLSIPGSLSASAFSSIIDVEEGWGSSPTNGPSQVPVKLPLVYYYGLANPEENTKIYKPVTTRLALSVMSRLQEDQEAKEAGCIVDTPGVISQGKGNYEVIQHIVSEFAINVIIILGSERLSSDMVRKFNGQKTSTDDTITVLKLDKSGGCVDRDESYLKQYRQAQIREYFFGDSKITLSPHTQQVDFNQVTIYKLAELPPSSALQHSILALMHADANDTPENIRDASVIGFVYVAEVDEKKKKLRVLAPLSGRLPNRAMVWATWPEGGTELVG
ncbi:pre-mrna cleavage complex ii protein clp1 [Lasallia pustulata]|uniref:Polynucleotide 5'-hydroxyl-kinase GRC3 n=1 Tax=Lasallia pustulata TaxID=136370 RepID=A0A1W5D8Z3_9LECA|nr:pre-mrna cleavage complex ii protein clp1 [Lasallia pustulata]